MDGDRDGVRVPGLVEDGVAAGVVVDAEAGFP